MAEREDIFWRTASSGAMATKRKRSTYGQHGDIQAVDPLGQPLLDIFTIEVKRGYNKRSIQDLLDCPCDMKETPEVIRFIEQATMSSSKAGTLTWMVIWRRDRRQALIMYPHIKALDFLTRMLSKSPTYAKVKCWFHDSRRRTFIISSLDALCQVDPEIMHEKINDRRR
jgi:hypothetical protein